MRIRRGIDPRSPEGNKRVAPVESLWTRPGWLCHRRYLLREFSPGEPLKPRYTGRPDSRPTGATPLMKRRIVFRLGHPEIAHRFSHWFQRWAIPTVPGGTKRAAVSARSLSDSRFLGVLHLGSPALKGFYTGHASGLPLQGWSNRRPVSQGRYCVASLGCDGQLLRDTEGPVTVAEK